MKFQVNVCYGHEHSHIKDPNASDHGSGKAFPVFGSQEWRSLPLAQEYMMTLAGSEC